jgi:hypothetical protein
MALGASRRAAADIEINAPTGLSAGETFRIVFVTDMMRDGSSPNIDDYNTFVNNDATAEAGGGVVKYNGTTLTFSAIATTTSTSAITNIGETGAPIYLVDGTQVAASDTSSGLWSGSLMNPISVLGGVLRDLRCDRPPLVQQACAEAGAKLIEGRPQRNRVSGSVDPCDG